MRVEQRDILERVLEWYRSQAHVSDIERAGTDTVLKHGITGDYQANLVIDACQSYGNREDIDDTERQEVLELEEDVADRN